MANTYMDKHSTSLASVICKQNSYHQQNKNKGPTWWCMSIFQAMQEVEKGRRQLTDKNIRETHLNKQTGCGGTIVIPDMNMEIGGSWSKACPR
jgi:hypothetical protein